MGLDTDLISMQLQSTKQLGFVLHGSAWLSRRCAASWMSRAWPGPSLSGPLSSRSEPVAQPWQQLRFHPLYPLNWEYFPLSWGYVEGRRPWICEVWPPQCRSLSYYAAAYASVSSSATGIEIVILSWTEIGTWTCAYAWISSSLSFSSFFGSFGIWISASCGLATGTYA